jgi:hypothetical protein
MQIVLVMLLVMKYIAYTCSIISLYMLLNLLFFDHLRVDPMILHFQGCDAMIMSLE